MRRRAWWLTGAAVLVAVTGAMVVESGATHTTAAPEGPSVQTATVERGPLSTVVSQVGTLTYRAGPDSSPLTVVDRAAGTYTHLPAAGDKVDCGEVLFRVDDRPVLLLCGTVPAYRDLHAGDAGPDVQQLNQNLHLLGDDSGAEVDPQDDRFTSRTEAALKVLQQRQGLAGNGVLGIDTAVFVPWAVRIADVPGVLGGPSQPGAPVLQVTSDTLEVHVELDAAQQEAVKPGQPVRITLPGNTSAAGKVDRLGRIARTPSPQDTDPGNATIGAYISLDHPEQARGLDTAPVRVEITVDGVADALNVPVTALVGRSGGGFAVEVVGAGDRRDLVAVTLGLFDTAGGRVQVEGEVHEGQRVVVPSL